MAILHMRIPDDLKAELDAEAERTHRSVTATVVLALRAYLGIDTLDSQPSRPGILERLGITRGDAE